MQIKMLQRWIDHLPHNDSVTLNDVTSPQRGWPELIMSCSGGFQSLNVTPWFGTYCVTESHGSRCLGVINLQPVSVQVCVHVTSNTRTSKHRMLNFLAAERLATRVLRNRKSQQKFGLWKVLDLNPFCFFFFVIFSVLQTALVAAVKP